MAINLKAKETLSVSGSRLYKPSPSCRRWIHPSVFPPPGVLRTAATWVIVWVINHPYRQVLVLPPCRWA